MHGGKTLELTKWIAAQFDPVDLFSITPSEIKQRLILKPRLDEVFPWRSLYSHRLQWRSSHIQGIPSRIMTCRIFQMQDRGISAMITMLIGQSHFFPGGRNAISGPVPADRRTQQPVILVRGACLRWKARLAFSFTARDLYSLARKDRWDHGRWIRIGRRRACVSALASGGSRCPDRIDEIPARSRSFPRVAIAVGCTLDQ